jgi:hypothetical protein
LRRNLGSGSHSHYHAIAGEQGAVVDDANLAHFGAYTRARGPSQREKLGTVLDEEFSHRW